MNSIINMLRKYNNFEECVIVDVRWRDFGTTFELVLDYIWDKNGNIRKDLTQEKRVSIYFKLVQDFNYHNALNPSMIREPENINWGINEISGIKLMDNVHSLEKYKSFPIPFYFIRVASEGEWGIDIICASIEIVDPNHAAH